jgi:hypothetical protein
LKAIIVPLEQRNGIADRRTKALKELDSAFARNPEATAASTMTVATWSKKPNELKVRTPSLGPGWKELWRCVG